MADLRYAIRLLRRDPGYAAVAILTIALGIGAATTLFGVAYGVLMKPLPFPDASRIMRVTETRKGHPARLRGTISNGPYLAWRDAASTAILGGYGVVSSTMTVLPRQGLEPVRLQVGRLTSSMFDVLEIHPVRGRAFLPEDERVGSAGPYPPPKAIVLSYGLWQDWFGGRDDAIGRVVRVDDLPVTIVGVMPRGFAFPDPAVRAWLPMPIGPVNVIDAAGRPFKSMMIFGALARLKRGYTPAQAAAEGTARARTAPDPGLTAVGLFGSTAPPDIAVTPAVEAMTADVRPAILLLLAAVALLLATAVANVGGLQLARASTRRREMAVRAALGAGRAALLRQLLAESAVVSAAGAAVGIAIAFALARVLPSMLPADFPRAADIAVNVPVLAFAVALSVAASVGASLMPATLTRRLDVTTTLADESAASSAGAWRSRSGRVRTAVMAAQVAVACVLLVGAALLARSFVALMQADRGYDPTHVLTAQLDLPRRYDGPGRAAFLDAVADRLRATPRVQHVAAGNALPFVSMGGSAAFQMPSPVDPGVRLQVQTLTRVVSPEYFAAMRLRSIAGRLLLESDTRLSRPVIVVNRSFARRYLGDRPLGMRVPLPFGDGQPGAEVVGVVDDMRQGDIGDAPAAEVFVSYRQLPARLLNGPVILVERTVDDPLAHVEALRTAVREQDATVAIDSIMTMEERVATSLAKPRLYATLLGGFAIAALAIAAVGLFGVLSYAVAQRRREIAVRTALGAQAVDIAALVLRQAIAIAATGVGAGLWLAFALTRYVASFLYGVGRFDAASYAAVGLAVMAVAAVACLVPARRAARVDPIDALRQV